MVLDGHTLNPGDLSWDDWQRYFHLRVFPHTPPSLVLERAQGAAVLATNKTPLTGQVIKKLDKLQLINVLATGYDLVDTNTAKERGIAVCNAAGYSTQSVAQHVFALLLSITNRPYPHHLSATEKGQWAAQAHFSYTLGTVTELNGKTIGLVGFGQIATEVARIAQAFGMKVLVHRRQQGHTPPMWVTYCHLSQLLAASHVVSLHCPLTPQTREMVNTPFLAQMKPGAILINTARGGLIDETALSQALRSGHLAGAAVDVLGQEPPVDGSPLLTAPSCLVTPHMAWASIESRKRLMDISLANILGFLNGQIQHRVA